MQCSYFSRLPSCNFSSFRHFAFFAKPGKTVLISVPTHVIVIVIVAVVVTVVVVVVVVVFVVVDTEMSA